MESIGITFNGDLIHLELYDVNNKNSTQKVFMAFLESTDAV
jgi:hypothetical protein